MIFVYILLFIPSIIQCENNVTSKGKEKVRLRNRIRGPDVVDVKLFYEAFCPHCINFQQQLENVLLVYSPRLFIHTYPYGKAKMTVVDDKVQITCHHGSRECYGNTLHACVLKHVANQTQALLINVCMMTVNGSDDTAAEKCSKNYNIDVSPILQCAKSNEGLQLLRYYGEESRKVNIKRVPYMLVNGVQIRWKALTWALCAAFKNPPPTCPKTNIKRTKGHNGTIASGV